MCWSYQLKIGVNPLETESANMKTKTALTVLLVLLTILNAHAYRIEEITTDPAAAVSGDDVTIVISGMFPDTGSDITSVQIDIVGDTLNADLIGFYQGGGGLCQRVQLFSENPIPAGSLLILLSVGPVLLLPHVEKCWRLPLTLLLVLGGVVILLIGQRGAILALLCMLVLGGLAKFKRFWIYPVFMVLLLGLGFSYKDKLPNLYYNKLVNWESVFIRLEYYRIAYQVVKEKPVFGIGFNAPIVRFIPPDYEAKYFRSDRGFSFNSVVAGVQTFDNMALCFFAEAGSLFALTYIFLFGCLFKRSFRLVGIGFGARFYIFGIGAIVIGFAVQSLTFDSLRYPHLNWVFHSILGVLANLDVLCDKDPLRQASSPRTGSDILLGASLNN